MIYNKGGNIFPKFTSSNPFVKIIIKGYFSALFKLLDGLEFNSLCDIGCGEGEIIYRISQKYPGKYILGIDKDKDILEKARDRNPNIKFEVQDITNLKLPDNSFDLVICLEVLEHLKNPEIAIKELIRISRRYLLFSVPLEPLWSCLNLCRLAYIKNLGNTPGHIQKWSKKSFMKMLSKFLNIKLVCTPLPWIMILSEVKKNV